MTAADLSCHIGDIARRLLGPPNDRLSTRHQLRFGSNGSVCVEIDGPKRGSWFDHENSCGGGPWDLLRLKGNLVNGAAIDWLASEIGIQVGGRGGLNIVATYDYRDEQGNLLFQQCRLEPKSFRQRRPDGNGGWIWKTQGVRKVLYCLPELLATPPESIVFVVEGEKDVDNLRRNGLVATCNPGGAAKRGADGKPEKPKWLSEYDSFFADLQVVVLPDNDDAGRDHASAVVDRLLPVAATVRVVELPGLPPKGDVSDWLAAGGTRDELLNLVAGAPVLSPDRAQPWNADAQPVKALETRRPAADRAVVKLVGGNLPFAIDLAEAILIERDKEIYQRGDFVVRPAPEMVPIADQRQTCALRLVSIKTQHMVERFTRFVDFEKFDARTRDWVSINCPPILAAAYLERIGGWNLPVLSGITNAPILRSDGSILEVPGYDQATGILYDPRGVTYPAIPGEPTRERALAALRELTSLISEFPFVPDDVNAAPTDTAGCSASRSVALCGMITALIRRSLPTAPLHAYTAPSMGSGKSKLVDLASMIATGHEAPVLAQGKTEEEMEKRLGAALIAGDTLISLDNCEQPLGGELLCQTLTQSALSIRILGKSVNVTVPANTAVFATGNNLAVAGDMMRRTIVCSLDPKVERPELRRFTTEDPVKRVSRDRPKYVTAILTILRAFHVAGRPNQGLQPLGSFESWSDLVRSALVWLGEPDPCRTMESTRAEDPHSRGLSAVLYGWHGAVGDRELTAKRAIEYASEPEGGSCTWKVKHPEFREALIAVAGDRGEISVLRLGKWLGKMKGKVVDGLRIEIGAVNRGEQRWRVVRI